MPLLDTFGRVHDYLRISLTDRCNLRCIYCMPDLHMRFMPPARLMQADELITLARHFVSLGVKKIRLTGGEPLIRKDAAQIIESLGRLPVELAITTNAFFLDRFFDLFDSIGLRSLNISLDTLDEKKFQGIAQKDSFRTIWKNVETAVSRGYHVKLNMVVMREQNLSEVPDFIELTRSQPLHVRLIEFMPFACNKWNYGKTVSYAEMLELIQGKFDFEKIKDAKNDTARNFRVRGAEGTFAIISSVTNPFCSTCNRIRLTADGKIKNCLFSRDEGDLLSVLRSGGDVKKHIVESITAKHAARGGLPPFESKGAAGEFEKNRAMISIGG